MLLLDQKKLETWQVQATWEKEPKKVEKQFFV
jgi:hypothetical protein